MNTDKDLTPVTQRTFDFETLDRLSVRELWTPDEIYERASDDLLAKFYEDERLERKPAGMHAEPLATWVCMWANTPPAGGIIVLGIEDDGTLTGCTVKAEALVDIERRIRAELVPDAELSTKRVLVTLPSGKPDFVIFCRVQYRHDRVVETNKGEAYIRRCNSRHLLTPEEVQELKIERGQLSFELEPCGLPWPDGFNASAIRAFIAGVRKLKRIDTELSQEQILINHRLGRIVKGQFTPNNSCGLLFANDPREIVPGCMIRFQRIEGSDAIPGRERNVVKDVQIAGTVPTMIAEADELLDTHLRVYSRFADDGKFYTAPEYPYDAWHEGIVNACAHRSYSLKGANIWIRMYDDRLVIESPGGFPPFITEENINEGYHYRRNWWLMDAMQYLEFVKCEGEGIKRMRSAMKAMSLPEPHYEQKQIGDAVVRVTLRNNQNLREKWVDADLSELIGKDMAASLTPLQIRILNFAVEHGKINTTEAMQFMARPRWHAADRELKKLVKKGLLRYFTRYKRDSAAHYVLVAKKPAKSS